MKEVLKGKFVTANMYIRKKTLKNNLHFHLSKQEKKKKKSEVRRPKEKIKNEQN